MVASGKQTFLIELTEFMLARNIIASLLQFRLAGRLIDFELILEKLDPYTKTKPFL